MKYENPSLCATCGGCCCKNDPCFFMPDDFTDLSVDGLIREFEQKDYLCIYLSEVPNISMRGENWPKVTAPHHLKKSNRCVLLTDRGCPFSYDERPTGGKLFVPNPDGDCYNLVKTPDINMAWAPYMKTLLQVAAHFMKKASH